MSKRRKISSYLGPATLLYSACQMGHLSLSGYTGIAAARGGSHFRMETTGGLGLPQGDGDHISLSETGNMGTINVTHKLGIGAVKLILEKGQWPRKIKLVLTGFSSLENVTISGGHGSIQFHREKIEKEPGDVTIFVPPEVIASALKQIDISWVDACR